MKRTSDTNQDCSFGFIPWVDFVPPGNKTGKGRQFPGKPGGIIESMHV